MASQIYNIIGMIIIKLKREIIIQKKYYLLKNLGLQELQEYGSCILSQNNIILAILLRTLKNV